MSSPLTEFTALYKSYVEREPAFCGDRRLELLKVLNAALGEHRTDTAAIELAVAQRLAAPASPSPAHPDAAASSNEHESDASSSDSDSEPDSDSDSGSGRVRAALGGG